MTPESRKKISDARKGLKLSDETKKRMSLSKLKMSDETRKKMSIAKRGRARPPMTLEHKKKLSLANSGEKAPNWKGGKTKINAIIRGSFEYRLWRESVFNRDSHTCVWCFKRGGILHADHIKPFAYFPELRFAIDNGRTLCKECHKTTETYAGGAKKLYGRL